MENMAGLPESFASRFLIILLFLQLFTMGSAQFSVIGPVEPVLALEGGDAEMTCHLNTKESAEFMEVRWFRSQPSNLVHLYYKGKDLCGEQMKEYQGRTELVTDAIDYGSVAIRIRNVRVSDEGNYHCSFYDDFHDDKALLELQVVAPLFPTALSLMVALGVTLSVLGLLIAGGLYLSWKQHRDKEKLQRALRWNLFQLYEANITLDPDTAYRFLVLSEDQKRVMHGDTEQDLPDNPERFNHDSCVLGRERFTSGRHCWGVEVGDRDCWDVGVCKENVRRKGAISESPEHGFWAVEKDEGEYRVLTSPRTRLPLSTAPSRVVVFLDYEAGDVSFYSGTDGSHIYTFPRADFSGTLRPFFYLWSQDPTPLTICRVPSGAGGDPVPATSQDTSVTPPEKNPDSATVDGDRLPESDALLLPPQPQPILPPLRDLILSLKLLKKPDVVLTGQASESCKGLGTTMFDEKHYGTNLVLTQGQVLELILQKELQVLVRRAWLPPNSRESALLPGLPAVTAQGGPGLGDLEGAMEKKDGQRGRKIKAPVHISALQGSLTPARPLEMSDGGKGTVTEPLLTFGL
ncbi:butyrophilin subfamily 1 member A1-like [Tachyglossus aculeatus]|uniref:butyrophilin subfamily 1 member A1-like n=1 Tax=Tachyglossus aculeatus TaxID=9261 RepID=UPI0018F359C0|nr:butyrophilin subfamily 1 member A1-like [Tachyglossus aculeatus]